MGGWRYNSALDGGEWLASCPVRFTPGKSPQGTHWIGSRVGPTIGLYSVEKRKTFHAGNRTQAVKPVAHRYTDSWDVDLLAEVDLYGYSVQYNRRP
jgi:hypothetical protein